MAAHMDPPRKRRRLSDGKFSDVSSETSSSPGDEQTVANTRASSIESETEGPSIAASTSTISRIRAKKDGPKPVTNSARTSQDDREPRDTSHNEGLPASIQDAIDDDSTFATLGVDPWLIASLSHMAIKWPTRIQKACIPQIMQGRDCIGGSRTGTGKTVAFAVPILQRWARDPSGIFAVILTPTRELALQIYEQFQAIGSSQGIKSILVTGGADMRTQALELAKRPHVVIATPGRLADHISTSGSDTVHGLRKCRFVVFDEADRLLASGAGSMLPDVETCLSMLPSASHRQTLLFTATVTPEVRALKEMPRAPDRAAVFVHEADTAQLAVPATLRQTYQLVNVVHKEKYLHVLLLTPANAETAAVVFCNRTATANLLEYLLRRLGHRVTALHSGLRHEERVGNLARFRARAARILVATDVAARGLDVPDVGLVVNYDLPRDPDDYIHRVGRTARAGRKGTAISLVGQRDVELVQAIEARVGAQMTAYEEDKVNVETRVVRDALNLVGEKKREALLAIEEGRDVKGKRVRRMENAMVK